MKTTPYYALVGEDKYVKTDEIPARSAQARESLKLGRDQRPAPPSERSSSTLEIRGSLCARTSSDPRRMKITPEKLDDAGLLNRAYAAWFRSGGYDQPNQNLSEVRESGGKTYVVLENTNRVLAV